MEKYLNILTKSPLLKGVAEDEIGTLLSCLSASVSSYEKNSFILRAGDPADSVGMILSGGAHVIKEDFWGNRNLLSHIAPSQLFAETYACSTSMTLAVSVIAVEPTTVLFLGIRRLLTTCTSACTFHTRLIRNLLSVMAEKNLLLHDKLTHMTQRTTREKLLSYLSSESARQDSASFELPFNRQQLADFLSVDRSAMSNELCKMRDEGLLRFYKSSVTLLQKQD
ncbi:MAG: Crp/Fnr family transcriptional regulator [Clostridium sp. SCN 57-10]|nr:MAG: Crp/Fnr family transcriptional regulator [Clostridium sp. SCN 57-10]